MPWRQKKGKPQGMVSAIDIDHIFMILIITQINEITRVLNEQISGNSTDNGDLV